ncbi:MAG: aminoglycoside phosphotransferase family protein [Acidimicrobiia bacterium]|nr:aminoglycoside phosphotransferase family protein [Acidimicrobiia bacterium]
MPRSLLPDAESIARQILQRNGLTGRDLRRAPSTSNEVFLADDHVIRINRDSANAVRLLREAELCLALPRLRWTPEIVEYGRLNGTAFLIVRRKGGMTLSRWWPDMRPSQRREAIEQLAGCMRAVHSTTVPDGLDPITDTPQLLGSAGNPALPVLHGLQGLRSVANIDPSLIDDLESTVHSLASSLEMYPESGLVHGDLSLENVLWDGSSISAILDFEWARGAPRELDLDVLCRFLVLPDLHVPEAYRGRVGPGDYREVIGWLADSYPELFSPADLDRRLTLFAVAYEVRAVLANPPKVASDRLSPVHPYRRLIDVAADGGPAASLVRPLIHRGASHRR